MKNSPFSCTINARQPKPRFHISIFEKAFMDVIVLNARLRPYNCSMKNPITDGTEKYNPKVLGSI